MMEKYSKLSIFCGDCQKKKQFWLYIECTLNVFLVFNTVWMVLFRDQILQNIFHNVLSNPIALGVEMIAVPLVILFMIKQKTKGNKPAVVWKIIKLNLWLWWSHQKEGTYISIVLNLDSSINKDKIQSFEIHQWHIWKSKILQVLNLTASNVISSQYALWILLICNLKNQFGWSNSIKFL